MSATLVCCAECLYKEYGKLHKNGKEKKTNSLMLAFDKTVRQVWIGYCNKTSWSFNDLMWLVKSHPRGINSLYMVNTVCCLCAYIDHVNNNTVGRDFLKFIEK